MIPVPICTAQHFIRFESMFRSVRLLGLLLNALSLRGRLVGGIKH
ncbi:MULTISPECIES: leu operon leader peptide [Pantoea]|nr:leu operon leader peptide [Pantoea sp. 1B4]MBO0638233.1 leu operon leader peptide [Pantoea agglomerans]QXB58496.1 leu operon leader peptide [Pantoea agglomerans]QXG54080.1 leu operon leader peptide [Pantoea jilinensis]UJL37739.1 leu operon leader peptide [Pantoea agglomerans]